MNGKEIILLLARLIAQVYCLEFSVTGTATAELITFTVEQQEVTLVIKKTQPRVSVPE